MNVSVSFSALLMILCLLAASGCGTGAAGVRDHGALSAVAESEDQDGGAKREQADTEVSAFSLEEAVREKPKDLAVQFLDVGQGSAALIRQDGHFMLVDGGDRETSSFVVSFLKEQGVTKLDYVVVSHYDSDHLAGIIGVLNVFPCGQVLAPDYEGDTKLYESFRSVVEEKGISVAYPKLGDRFSFGGSSFRVVSPATYEYEDDNAKSLGIRLEYGDNSFLLCGDCTAESEQDLLYLGTELQSDVFAANHHGSKYSNSQEFLEAVAPEYVVISCGRDNSYGHPDASVLLEIQKLGADLFRTDLQGTITALSDGETIRFAQEPSADYRSGAEIAEADASGGGGASGSGGSGSAGSGAAGSDGSGSAGGTAGNGDGTEPETGAGSGDMEENQSIQYVLNTNTMKFHLPQCSSVEDIKEENKAYSTQSRDEIMEQGYSPCKRCDP